MATHQHSPAPHGASSSSSAKRRPPATAKALPAPPIEPVDAPNGPSAPTPDPRRGAHVANAIAAALCRASEVCGAGRAEAEAELLRRLAENVHALVAVDSGGEPLRPAPLDLSDVLMGVLPSWTSGNPRHTFELALPGSLPTVIADAALVERAVNALLAAAVRATPGGAAIRASVRALGDAVEVSVSTTRSTAAARAPGSDDPSDEDDDFFSADSDPAAAPLCAPNAGLDLTLARAVVERHGGQARSRSRSLALGARGVEFVTTWPLMPPPAPGAVRSTGETATPEMATPAARRPAPLPVKREPTILLIAGDARMGRFLRGNLEAQGHAVTVVASVDEARAQADIVAPDLAVLDLAPPTPEGHAEASSLAVVLAALDCPTIVLAGQNDPLACARALDQGAADWLARPFSAEELLARVRAALRRSLPRDTTEPLFACGELTIDFAQRLVTVSGAPAPLSKTEYKLLRTLAQHPGRVLSHETLLERVWGPGYADAVEFLWVYVRRLRRKIEPDPARPRYIETVPGVGYRLAPRPQ